MKKICVITGTRAEYGLLRRLMLAIREESTFELQVIVTGTHLSPMFGLTYREIEADGILINRKVEMLLGSDTASAVSKSMGLALIGFADAYTDLKPDMVIVLGDRYEIFSAASAALIAHIPIAHLHGGEVTEGAFDDALRHAITKMSHLHFVSTKTYRTRVLQLGEEPSRVFEVGGLGIDSINGLELLSRSELESSLEFNLGARNLLVTYHPVTLEPGQSASHMQELLSVLDTLDDTKLIFTMPNADNENHVLRNMIEDYVATNPNAKSFSSLGQLRYFSAIAQVDGVIGNSSSGLLEVPSFKKGTINIGDRQKGRLKAESIIDAKPDRNSIMQAVEKLYSEEFQKILSDVKNPYGEAGASEKILKVLKHCNCSELLKKKFYDVSMLVPD